MRSIAVFLFAAALITACGAGASEQSVKAWPVDFEALVDLHCQARSLREQRFALADSMRSYTERNMALKGWDEATLANDSLMRVMNLLKDSLVTESESAADKIKLQLEKVIANLDVNEKRVFNDSITKTTIRRGC